MPCRACSSGRQLYPGYRSSAAQRGAGPNQQRASNLHRYNARTLAKQPINMHARLCRNSELLACRLCQSSNMRASILTRPSLARGRADAPHLPVGELKRECAGVHACVCR
eukprot:4357430-Pleurochrysis_carterae.AAC.1